MDTRSERIIGRLIIFPEDFMFRLSEDEFKVLIFQNGTSSWGGTRMRQTLMDNTDIRLEIERIKRQLSNYDKNMEIVFQYLDELAEKKETASAQVERKRIGYVLGKENQMMKD